MKPGKKGAIIACCRCQFFDNAQTSSTRLICRQGLLLREIEKRRGFLLGAGEKKPVSDTGCGVSGSGGSAARFKFFWLPRLDAYGRRPTEKERFLPTPSNLT